MKEQNGNAQRKYNWEKAEKWANTLCVLCIVVCIIGAIAALIVYAINISAYNEDKKYIQYASAEYSYQYSSLYQAGQDALSAKQAADFCFTYIFIFVLTAILSPIYFGWMYAPGVIVIELQTGNRCAKTEKTM